MSEARMLLHKLERKIIDAQLLQFKLASLGKESFTEDGYQEVMDLQAHLKKAEQRVLDCCRYEGIKK